MNNANTNTISLLRTLRFQEYASQAYMAGPFPEGQAIRYLVVQEPKMQRPEPLPF